MLQLLLMLPLLASALVLSLDGAKSHVFAMFAGTCVFLLSVVALFSLQQNADSILHYSTGLLHLRVDSISAIFIVLTALLTVKDKSNGYFSLFFLLEAAVIGVFCATDLLTFYILFKFSLVPLFFIIGIWGNQKSVCSI